MPKEYFIKYLKNKVTEIQHLSFKDILLAKAVAAIFSNTIKTEMKYVSLSSIVPIHCIDRRSAIDKINHRVNILSQHKDEILALKTLNKDNLLKYLPSVSGIKVIKDTEQKYISFEGNGRIEAFKQVFNNDDIELQVEEYVLNNHDKIIQRVNRDRKRNFPDQFN